MSDDRHKREHELVISLVTNLKDAVVVVNAQGIVQFANPASERLFGRAQGGMVGENFGFPIAADGADAELQIPRPNGSVATGEMRVTELEWNEAPVVLASIRDISERKRLEHELQQTVSELARSNKDLDQFAFVASHDLKAPLRDIANLARWIAEDDRDALSPETTQRLKQLRGRVKRLRVLLDDLLTYSRAGLTHRDAKPARLGDLCASVLDLVRRARDSPLSSPRTGRPWWVPEPRSNRSCSIW